MPKPIKNLPTLAEIRAQAARDAKRTPRKPSNDPMIHARQIMANHMGKIQDTTAAPEPQPEPTDIKAIISAHMSTLGKKGGKIGGAKRRDMPAAKRKAIAMKGAAARWGKKSGQS